MENRTLPMIRFTGFSNEKGYPRHKFEDIFTFSSGKNIKQNEASPEYEVPCVRYGELYHMYGEVISKTINCTNLPRSELTFSFGNEILLPSAGEDPLDIGSASALMLKDVAIGRTINVLRPNGTIDYSPIYVSYYINEKLRKKISTLARGASISNVYNSDLKGLKINLPSIDEQKKVAEFLSSVDEKISLIKEKHALLTQYKKGVMQKLFKQEIRFKDDNGNAFPDWQEQKFEQVFERVTRKNKEDNQNVLTISAQQGLINQEKYFNKSVSAKDVTGYYLLEKGDFAYNKSYSKGYPMGAIKRLNNYDKGVVSTLYICFKSHGEQHDEFWEQYFEAGNLNREINKIAQEGARNHGLLNVSVSEFFHDVKILAPCYEEQQKIAAFLRVLDKKLDAVNQQIELTQTFKKGLLQQMFV
ncbi:MULTISPECIES: restriction endonuclease subunit S [Pseudoalteromonas]|jgi:type I restriction enzyme S subunit|uniref:restriction endonuclease subunit S n=1 Tax=Pseudoalteromonas TaxID=53246 RepID=UPI001E2E7AE5|nr:restriction endonuclease subunit S [Pseudoalteromonas sp. MB41]MCC9662057.1 restriction endonuclease subunit S [Pseudoalteromonas sp. MB41]